jgi:hypothetical protein
MLRAPDLADGYGKTDHQHQPKNMKPTKHTGANIAVINATPGPI